MEETGEDEGTRVALIVAGREGEGRTSGLERKMKEVSIEVTVRETERPGLERSSMYQRAGLTRARVTVSWRVDCQGSRRCLGIIVSNDDDFSPKEKSLEREKQTHNSKSYADKSCHAPDYIVDLLADGRIGRLGLLLLFILFACLALAPLSIPHEINVWEQAAERDAE